MCDRRQAQCEFDLAKVLAQTDPWTDAERDVDVLVDLVFCARQEALGKKLVGVFPVVLMTV